MVILINNNKYKYKVKTNIYNVYLFNKQDAIKFDNYYTMLLKEIEIYVFESYSNLLIWYNNKQSKTLEQNKSVSLITNSIYHITFNTHADKERLLFVALNEYVKLSYSYRKLSYSKLIISELKEFPFSIQYQSKHLITNK